MNQSKGFGVCFYFVILLAFFGLFGEVEFDEEPWGGDDASEASGEIAEEVEEEGVGEDEFEAFFDEEGDGEAEDDFEELLPPDGLGGEADIFGFEEVGEGEGDEEAGHFDVGGSGEED